MELRGLRSLIALAESGSITRTAERLHLSAAAIHKQLKLLEEELGVRLYEKAGKQLRLTQAADVILPHVRNLLAEYDAALAALGEWKGLKRGLVRVGAGPTFSSYTLPALLKEFRRRYPDVELFVETGHTPFLIEGLKKGAIDLIFIVASELLEGPGLAVEAMWDFEIVLVSGLRASPARCRLAELRALPFVLYRQGSVFENLIDRYFAEQGFRPRVVTRSDNAEAIKALVRSGLGVSMLPRWAVEAELKEKKLALIRQQEPPLAARLALVTRRPGYTTQPVSAFIEVARGWKWKSARLLSR